MLELVHLPITGFSCTVFLAYIRQVKRGLKAGGSPKQCVKSKQSSVFSETQVQPLEKQSLGYCLHPGSTFTTAVV